MRDINRNAISAENIQFRGIPIHERYYNENSAYGVYAVKCFEDTNIPNAIAYGQIDYDFSGDDRPYCVLIVSGKMQQLYVGSEYDFIARASYNDKYKQFNYIPTQISAIAPMDAESSMEFLASILTKKQAATLLENYPQIISQVIDGTDNVNVSKLKGIGTTTWEKLRQKIVDNYVISDIIVMLQPLGITYAAIQSMLKYEPNSAILKQKIKDNPYFMTEIRGFGFKRVDGIALKMHPELIDSPKRLFAFIKWFLNQRADQDGHTWVTMQTLKNGVCDDVPQCINLFESLEQKNDFPVFLAVKGTGANAHVGLTRYYNTENAILQILLDLDRFKFSRTIDIEKGIASAEVKLGYSLTEEQKTVVKQIQDHNVILFTGSAGTGKTSVARAILECFPDSSIGCCALAAKAAQRIKEATGFKAMTIHRLLKYNGMKFAYNSIDRMDYDVVFLDEASMLNCDLLYDLVSAVKEGAKVVICGDALQLPPIGAGNVFSDLLNMKEMFNISVLTKVHRQAEMSGILSDANKIRKGIIPMDTFPPSIVSGELKDMLYMFRESQVAIHNAAVDTFCKIVNLYGIDGAVLAVPRKSNVINSASALNSSIQQRIIDVKNTPYIEYGDVRYYVGDRVLQIENDGQRDVYNGEVGYVEKVIHDKDKFGHCLEVRFEFANGEKKIIEYTMDNLKTLTLGYAMTVHKLQGSEYPWVVFVLDDTHFMLADTCLLYTAITRAKKKCIVVANPNAFQNAMGRNKNTARQTWLEEIINQKKEISGCV